MRRTLLALVGIALFLGFVALGTWQVERRTWKLALIERVEQRVHAAPAAPPPPAQWADVTAATHEYLPVQVQGQWIPGTTVLTQAVTEIGAGYWVLTALQLADGTQVLVNRGFIPQDQRARWLPDPTTSTATAATVQGLLRITEPGGGFLRTNDPAQQRWFSRDVRAIGQTFQLTRLAPFFIDAGLPGTSRANDAPWPRAGMTVIQFRNTHLVYALTWYGLALMVVVAAWYVARYERRLDQRSGRQEAP